jgi:hypothetical protein
LGHNLFSDTPGVALDPTDLINTDPLLGPLADNGGPTLTHALLPGSPALDAGVAVAGVTTDQRGIPRPQGSAPDIGAFESRGFTLAVVSGAGQSTPASSAFAAPLVVAVTSPFGEPVAGGRVTFTAPANGASAVLGGNSATINSDGQAAIIATANGSEGTYLVTARTVGALDTAFTLTNLAPAPTPPELTSPTIMGVVSVERSRKGITSIVLGFNEAMDPASAGNRGFYGLASGVKKKHKLAFTKAVKISTVSYDNNAHTVTLKLAKPAKGTMQVGVHAGILATNGLASRGDFTAVVK